MRLTRRGWIVLYVLCGIVALVAGQLYVAALGGCVR